MRKIYLATSWRNDYHQTVLNHLQALGHQVYNFKGRKNMGAGGPTPTSFSWAEIGIRPEKETAENFRGTLVTSSRVAQGYLGDFRGMEWADTGVLLLPAGNSAHLELGYMKGRGKRAIIYMPEGTIKPDLMYLLADNIVVNLEELAEVLE